MAFGELADDLVQLVVDVLPEHALLPLSLASRSLRRHALNTWRFRALLMSTPQYGTRENYRRDLRRYAATPSGSLDPEIAFRFVHNYVAMRPHALVNGRVQRHNKTIDFDRVRRWTRLETAMKLAYDEFHRMRKSLSDVDVPSLDTRNVPNTSNTSNTSNTTTADTAKTKAKQIKQLLAFVHTSLDVEFFRPTDVTFASILDLMLQSNGCVSWLDKRNYFHCIEFVNTERGTMRH